MFIHFLTSIVIYVICFSHGAHVFLLRFAYFYSSLAFTSAILSSLFYISIFILSKKLWDLPPLNNLYYSFNHGSDLLNNISIRYSVYLVINILSDINYFESKFVFSKFRIFFSACSSRLFYRFACCASSFRLRSSYIFNDSKG